MDTQQDQNQDQQDVSNDQLVLVVGYSTTGKTASLRNIRNQERWVYLNCESGKRPPFKNKFNMVTVTDPEQVPEYLQQCIDNIDDVDGIIIDSLSFLMDMYETQYVLNSANTMKAWGDYGQFFKNIMQNLVPKFRKPIIIIADVRDDLDERSMDVKTSVPIIGALKNQGVEAYFSTVVAAKKIPLKELEKYGSKMLSITDDEKEVGYKHVFQTRITKNSTGERIRSPMGMFERAETYIDNDVQILIDHLNDYYSI